MPVSDEKQASRPRTVYCLGYGVKISAVITLLANVSLVAWAIGRRQEIADALQSWHLHPARTIACYLGAAIMLLVIVTLSWLALAVLFPRRVEGAFRRLSVGQDKRGREILSLELDRKTIKSRANWFLGDAIPSLDEGMLLRVSVARGRFIIGHDLILRIEVMSE